MIESGDRVLLIGEGREFSHSDPAACLSDGPEEPMPPEDIVPNVLITSVTPTLLDMFGVDVEELYTPWEGL